MLGLGLYISAASSLISAIVERGLKLFLPFISSQELGEEKITNGDFVDTLSPSTVVNAAGTSNITWDAQGGGSAKLIYNASDNTAIYLNLPNVNMVNGRNYYIVIDSTAILPGSQFKLNQGNGTALSGTLTAGGINSFYRTATVTNSALRLYRNDSGDNSQVYINSISVKELGQFSLDETTNNNNATLFTGNCLDFDGTNDYLDIDGFTISGTTATFAFWMNPDSISSTSLIIDFNSVRFILGFVSSTFQIHSNGTWSSFGSIQIDRWSRVVVTVDGTTAKCFVDGIQLGSNVTISNIDLSSAAEVKIGGRYDGTALFFNGSLSDFQIWNSVWSATDVANDYAEPNQLVSSVSVSNLKGWWAMTEGSGSVAVDNATAIGSELVTNGDFATDSDWTKETGWTISGGTANFSGGSGNRNMSQAIGITDGKTYEVEYTVSSISAGTVSVRFGAMSGISEVTASTTGVFSGFITANSSANGNVQIEDNDNNFVGSIDNVSVKEVSAGTISGATYTPAQSSIPQLGMMDWSNDSGVFLPPSPSNATQDILGNAVRDRLNSLNLTGTGYAEVADSASINPSAITVQCWIFSNTENAKGLVAKWGNGLLDYMLYKTTNTFRFYISTSNKASGTIPTTGWVNIAGTYDGSNIKTFINGTLSTTKAETTAIPNNTNVLEVGRYGSNSSYTYSERIDDVKIYDRALSADEILQNYNAGLSAHTN